MKTMERTFKLDRDLAAQASRKLLSSFREADQMERGEIPMKRYAKTEDMISDCLKSVPSYKRHRQLGARLP